MFKFGLIVPYLSSLPEGTPANIRIYLIFLETRIIGLRFAHDNLGLSSLKFYGGLRNTILFLQE